MLRDWLPQHIGQNYYKSSSVRDFLDIMYRLRDSEHLGRFWSMVAASGFYHKENSAALVQAAELLPWPDVVSWAEKQVQPKTSALPLMCCSQHCRATRNDSLNFNPGNAPE